MVLFYYIKNHVDNHAVTCSGNSLCFVIDNFFDIVCWLKKELNSSNHPLRFATDVINDVVGQLVARINLFFVLHVYWPDHMHCSSTWLPDCSRCFEALQGRWRARNCSGKLGVSTFWRNQSCNENRHRLTTLKCFTRYNVSCDLFRNGVARLVSQIS